MKKRLIVLIVVLSFGLFSLFAYIYGGTNFGFSGYPAFNSLAPTKPFTASGVAVSRRQYESYKDSIEAYVEDAKEYIKNANNDIKRIQEAQKKALDNANSVVDEYNSWLKGATISSNYF